MNRQHALTVAALVGLVSCTLRPQGAPSAPGGEVLLEAGATCALGNTGYALRCEADESEYEGGKRLLLVLPEGKGEWEFARGPRNFLLSCAERTPFFALIHAPASKESTLTLYHLGAQGVQAVWSSPWDSRERVQWSVQSWEDGRAVLIRRGEDSGQRSLEVPLQPPPRRTPA